MVMAPASRASASRWPTRCPRTVYAAPSLRHGAPEVFVLRTRKATGTRTTSCGSAVCVAAAAAEQQIKESATAPADTRARTAIWPRPVIARAVSRIADNRARLRVGARRGRPLTRTLNLGQHSGPPLGPLVAGGGGLAERLSGDRRP